MKDSQIYESKIGPEPRVHLEKSFKAIHDRGDDELLIQDVFENEVFEIWTGGFPSNDSENH